MGFLDDCKIVIEHHRVPDIPEFSTMSKTCWEQTFAGAPVKKNGGITRVLLVDKKHGGVYMGGSANCIHGDNYDKEKGRSIALGRLLRVINQSYGSLHRVESLSQAVDLAKETGASFDTDLVWKAFLGKKIS